MRDLLPNQVMNQIQSHIKGNCKIAESGFSANQMEEDAVTGALGERLRTLPDPTRELVVDGRAWNWSVSYSKFRGRGRDAAENTIGADGIFQIQFTDTDLARIWSKGILFQAKMEKNRNRASLFEEMNKMEEITPNESIVVEYDDNGYKAIKSRELLAADKTPKKVLREKSVSLGDLLADQFLECLVGVRGLFYDKNLERIFVPTKKDMKARNFPVKHQISIDISSGEISRVRKST